MTTYKRRLGDRYDGRLLRTLDPTFQLIPYIMSTRLDAQNHFEDDIDISITDGFLRELKKQGHQNITFLHLLVTAFVRTMSQKPALNRFVAGNRIYARNQISISLTIKKELTEESPETSLKIVFDPNSTLFEVSEKINAIIEQNKILENSNETDHTAEFLTKFPGFVLRFIVWALKRLDAHGLLPKPIHEASPFHTSVYVTDLGSIGIKSVYHHLYEFGTTSLFVAFGTRQRKKYYDENNQPVEKRFVNVKVVCDERITDGFYFARAFKLFNNLMKHPERLLVPPEKIVQDIK